MWNSGSLHITPSWLSLEWVTVLVPQGLQPEVGQGAGGTLSWSERGVQEWAWCSGPAMLELPGPAFKEQTQSLISTRKRKAKIPPALLQSMSSFWALPYCSDTVTAPEWGGGQGCPRGGDGERPGVHSVQLGAVAGPQPWSG